MGHPAESAPSTAAPTGPRPPEQHGQPTRLYRTHAGDAPREGAGRHRPHHLPAPAGSSMTAGRPMDASERTARPGVNPRRRPRTRPPNGYVHSTGTQALDGSAAALAAAVTEAVVADPARVFFCECPLRQRVTDAGAVAANASSHVRHSSGTGRPSPTPPFSRTGGDYRPPDSLSPHPRPRAGRRPILQPRKRRPAAASARGRLPAHRPEGPLTLRRGRTPHDCGRGVEASRQEGRLRYRPPQAGRGPGSRRGVTAKPPTSASRAPNVRRPIGPEQRTV